MTNNNLSAIFAKRRLATNTNSISENTDTIKKDEEAKVKENVNAVDSNVVTGSSSATTFSFQFDVATEETGKARSNSSNKHGKKKKKKDINDVLKVYSDSALESSAENESAATKLSPTSSSTAVQSADIVSDHGTKPLDLINKQAAIQPENKIEARSYEDRVTAKKSIVPAAEPNTLTAEESRVRAAKKLKQRNVSKHKSGKKSTSSKNKNKKALKKQATPAVSFDMKNKKINYGMVNRTSISNRQQRPIHPPGFEEVSEGERMQNVFSFGFNFQTSEAFQG